MKAMHAAGEKMHLAHARKMEAWNRIREPAGIQGEMGPPGAQELISDIKLLELEET